MVDGWTAGAALDATVLVVELRLAWVVAVARPNPPVEEPPSEKAGGGAVVVVAAVLLAPEYKTISGGPLSRYSHATVTPRENEACDGAVEAQKTEGCLPK